MAYTDREDLNYLGQLYLIGANQTPFLNAMGGLQQGAKTANSFLFPIAQPWALRAADQATAVKSEATSVTDVTEITYTRAQDYNTVQIMKYPYGSSFAKLSTFGEIGGISVNGTQPVRDENAFQKAAAMRQMAIDVEFAFLQGTYVAPATAATVGKTRGLKKAIATNTVAAGAAKLTRAHIQELLKEMATNGAQFQNMLLMANAYNIQVLTDLYGYAPDDRTIGGVAVKTILTDFAQLGVAYAPQMPTDEIYIVDMSVCSPVFVPVEGRIIVDEPVAITTAKRGGFLYTQIGLDYGPEEYHGSITGLAVV